MNPESDISTPDRVICVLGMHRSGTSCLTGSLQNAGLYLGDCHTWNPFNRKGNRENDEFVALNDAVLAANDGAWNKPPGKVSWLAEHRVRATEILESYREVPVLGFKDPRTLLVLQGWKKACPQLEFVGIVRHPNAVAQSLENRERMPRAEALALWYKYNKLLYKEYRRDPFPILSFDEDEDVFHQKLHQAIRQLELAGAGDDERFYDDTLRTSHKTHHKSLPWRVNRLYGRLLKLCL